MPATLHPDTLVIALSSTALFDLSESERIFKTEGVDAYADYQLKHEDALLKPGAAFYLVEKLLRINQEKPWVEVILLSRNSADSGLRIFNSIEHYGLGIHRAAFTSGKSPYRYVKDFGAHLFLSTHAQDVQSALQAGCAAATLYPSSSEPKSGSAEQNVKIAFDGDSVLFSDASERIFKTQGLDAFQANERREAEQPLPDGPFKHFLMALCRLQKNFPLYDCPIQTALVTARQAPAHKRVIRTLRDWGIQIDEALFLGGLDKSHFLATFDADIFFDDHTQHCASASRWVTAAHVPHGIANEVQAAQNEDEVKGVI